jgi:uncharacterized membrane protein YfcA
MDLTSLGIFLLIVAFGSYVQASTGFALGLIVIGAVTLLDLAPIALTATVLNILALILSISVLWRQHYEVHWKTVRSMGVGIVPGVALGLALLHALSDSAPVLLKSVLGIVILTAGVVLMLRPHPRRTLAPTPMGAITGLAGGILGGLFSTAGPPIVFFLYRQPLEITVIRSTLLMVFAVNGATRLVLNTLCGDLTLEVATLTALAIPMVLIAGRYGARLTQRIPAIAMRRFAFGLLVVLGASLLVPGK